MDKTEALVVVEQASLEISRWQRTDVSAHRLRQWQERVTEALCVLEGEEFPLSASSNPLSLRPS